MGLSVSAFFQDGRDLTTRGLLFQSLGPLGIVLVLTQVLRRSLMRTLLNRRVTFGMVVVTAAIAMDRALGMLAGVSSGQVLVFDCLIGAVAAALSTAYVFRWLAWPSVMMLGGAIWAAASPAHAMSAFSAASGLAFLTAVLLAWKSDGGPEPAPRSR
jgi:hypothetical protein